MLHRCEMFSYVVSEFVIEGLNGDNIATDLQNSIDSFAFALFTLSAFLN